MPVLPVSANAVQLSTATPAVTDTFQNGVLVSTDGKARAVSVGGDEYANGLLLTDAGQVRYVDATVSLPAGTVWSNGLPRSQGALCVSSNSAATYSNGIPIDANGAVCASFFAPPLDTFTGAALAYSTSRRLSSNYMGSAIRVRRSNDNAEQDIGFTGGDLDETALTNFVGANSAFVTTWYDQSGNARNATQATAVNQPRIVNAGVVDKVNGRVTLAYPSGTMRFGYSGAGLVSTNAWFFNVFATTDPVGLWHYSDTATFLDAWQDQAASTNVNMGSPTTRVNGNLISPLTRNNLRVAVTTGNLALASHGGVDTNTFAGQTPFYNGYDNIAGGGFSVNGSSPEFILYTSDQSATRAAIESNIMSFYGI